MDIMNRREKDQLLMAEVMVTLSLLKITDKIKEEKLAKEAVTQSDKWSKP